MASKYKVVKQIDWDQDGQEFWQLVDRKGNVLSCHDDSADAHAAAQEAVMMDREGY